MVKTKGSPSPPHSSALASGVLGAALKVPNCRYCRCAVPGTGAAPLLEAEAEAALPLHKRTAPALQLSCLQSGGQIFQMLIRIIHGW